MHVCKYWTITGFYSVELEISETGSIRWKISKYRVDLSRNIFIINIKIMNILICLRNALIVVEDIFKSAERSCKVDLSNHACSPPPLHQWYCTWGIHVSLVFESNTIPNTIFVSFRVNFQMILLDCEHSLCGHTAEDKKRAQITSVTAVCKFWWPVGTKRASMEFHTQSHINSLKIEQNYCLISSQFLSSLSHLTGGVTSDPLFMLFDYLIKNYLLKSGVCLSLFLLRMNYSFLTLKQS